MKRLRCSVLSAVAVITFLFLALFATAWVMVNSEVPAEADEKTVYLSGTAGNDSFDGTVNRKVKTFQRAKQLLDGADGRIVVSGQINITSDSEWTPEVGQTITVVRDPRFSAKMIAVHAGATLYIKDIEIGGNGVTPSNDSTAYLIDVDPNGQGGKLAVEGRVKINDAANGMNVHLPENSVIEVRGALTAGEGSIIVKSENGIGGTVFEHKIAEGSRGYEVTESDARAFGEASEIIHRNIVVSEVRNNSVVLSVTPENRITVNLRLETVDGEVLSEDGFTVVKGSSAPRPLSFPTETAGISGIPASLTHIEEITVDGGENLVVKRSSGTLSERYNEVADIRSSQIEKASENLYAYRNSSVEKNAEIVVKYAPDAFEVSFDNRGGTGNFTPYLVPYGTPNPDRFGEASVSSFEPIRSGYVYAGYAEKNGEEYSAMPAHSIEYQAGWRIRDIENAILGAKTVKIGNTILLSSAATVYGSINYSYIWFKDGSYLEGETSRMLILTEIEQSGSYVLEIVATDPLGYAPALAVTSPAVEARIERYGAGQDEKPDVPPTDIETDDPLPSNARLSVEKISSKNSQIKTPLGYRAVGRFFAKLTANGKEITPKKKITVKVKLEESILSDESLSVVMVGKDGNPTAREFRTENGFLVFETDTLGEFAIFVKTAVPWWAWIIIGCLALVLTVGAVGLVLYKKMKTISFDTDGGSEVKRKFALAGRKVPAMPVPEKNGADFVGWFLDEEKTQSFDYKTMPKADITLYAKWRPKFGGKNDANA